jgi:hypothetical protein
MDRAVARRPDDRRHVVARLVAVTTLAVLAGCELIIDIPPGQLAIDAGNCGGCAAPTPACEPTTNTCVECVVPTDCPSDRPSCAMNRCYACRDDVDCTTDVCLADATCAEASRILYVSPAGASATCQKAAPCSLDTAITLLAPGVDIIHLEPGMHLRSTGLIVPANAILTGDRATIVGDPAVTLFYVFTINTATSFAIYRVAFELGGVHAAVGCTDGTLDIRRSRIVNGAIAWYAMRCPVTMDRSVVSGHAYYGLTVNETDAQITSSFITDNGTNAVSSGGVLLTTVTGRIEHNTLSRNNANSAGADALRCTGTNTVSIRSNIIQGNSLPAIQATCEVSNSVIDLPYAGTGSDNISMDPLFVNPTIRDYHLMPSSPVLQTADPASTVTTDFDGEARPSAGTTRADPGADEL